MPSSSPSTCRSAHKSFIKDPPRLLAARIEFVRDFSSVVDKMTLFWGKNLSLSAHLANSLSVSVESILIPTEPFTLHYIVFQIYFVSIKSSKGRPLNLSTTKRHSWWWTRWVPMTRFANARALLSRKGWRTLWTSHNPFLLGEAAYMMMMV